jgi:hypothetical protein
MSAHLSHVEAYLCFFLEGDGGPKYPVADGSRSLLFRFAGDDRDFGAIVSEVVRPLAAGATGVAKLEFLVAEASDVARDGALFEIRLGSRLVGIGRLA